MLPIFTTLPLLALFGLGGILALPMVNPRKRDLAAYRLAQRLLDDADLQAGMRESRRRAAQASSRPRRS